MDIKWRSKYLAVISKTNQVNTSTHKKNQKQRINSSATVTDIHPNFQIISESARFSLIVNVKKYFWSKAKLNNNLDRISIKIVTVILRNTDSEKFYESTNNRVIWKDKLFLKRCVKIRWNKKLLVI
jgi:hypothetical protein